MAAFQAWTLDKARSLADHLKDHGDLDSEQRALLEALVAQHLKKHGEVEKSLAAIPAVAEYRDRDGPPVGRNRRAPRKTPALVDSGRRFPDK